MGGFGSGSHRRYDARAKTRSAFSLDIRNLHPEGLLIPGSHSQWKRPFDGHLLRAVQLHAKQGEVIVSVLSRIPGRELWDRYDQSISLEFTSCNYGGTRPWWICPSCSRRVAVLYAPRHFFACRHCFRLVYASQCESGGVRALLRVNKIRRRLGWLPGVLNEIGNRRKGMHRKTYDRLKAEHDYLVKTSLTDLAKEIQSTRRGLGSIRSKMNQKQQRRD